jgi:UDP-2,4-diacetamido-2,4,6-trideoxy-beta-L-altropyranose hydrolase
MRCLTLASALVAQGAEPSFLASPAVASVLRAFPAMDVEQVLSGAESLEALVQDAVRAAAGFDGLVFDHYGLAAEHHTRIAAHRPTLVIDDLADRPLAAGLVLDAGPARRAEDYAGLVGAHTELLLGPSYAPVRPAFAALRDTALARRGSGADVRHVLVSLGLTDVGGITDKVVRALLPRLGEATLAVAMGSAGPSLSALRQLATQDRRLTVHVDTQDMARLTALADLAVGAAGTATWERCVLGVPTILLSLADNQVPAAQALEAAGAALVLDAREPDFAEALGTAVNRALGDAALRADLSRRAARVCDGRGAERTAAALMGLLLNASLKE